MSLQPRTIKILRKVKKAITNEAATVGFNMAVIEDFASSNSPDRSRARTPCGTVRCIGGWMLAFVNAPRNLPLPLLDTLLEILQEKNYAGFGRLFFMRESSIGWSSATVDQALLAIDQFIETDGEHAWVGADTDLPHNLILDLRKVQKILREGHPTYGFNMSHYEGTVSDYSPDHSPSRHKCGTTFCIGGWLAHLNGLNTTEGTVECLQEYYGLQDKETLYDLFNPRNTPYLWRHIPTEGAIKAIDRFIETGGKHSW